MANNEGINSISKVVEVEQKNQKLYDSILNKMPCYDKYEEINMLSSKEVELLKKFHELNKKEKLAYFSENGEIVQVLFSCLKTDFNVHLLQYVLTVFFETIRNDGSIYNHILSVLKEKNVYAELMKLCTHDDNYIADKGAFILSGSFCYNVGNIFTENDIKDFILKIDFFNLTEEGKMDVFINILKIDKYRKEIYAVEQFLPLIQKNLELGVSSNNINPSSSSASLSHSHNANNVTSSNANKQYKAVFCVWLLTFKEYFIKKMHKSGIILLIINLLKKCRVEKIVRICLNIIRNIYHIDDCFEIIVENNIIQTLTVLEYDKWRDSDIYDSIMQLLHKLDQRIKNFSNFERYCNELSKGKLKWSVLHTEKFWLENVMYFEKDEFKAIQKLADIIKAYAHQLVTKSVTNGKASNANGLVSGSSKADINSKHNNNGNYDSSGNGHENGHENINGNGNSAVKNESDELDSVTVSVACFDLGEFARLYPNGKKICQNFRVKENVMLLITTKNREVAREALLCAQKIMLNNWQSVSSSSKQ